jgi:hypothetical protein
MEYAWGFAVFVFFLCISHSQGLKRRRQGSIFQWPGENSAPAVPRFTLLDLRTGWAEARPGDSGEALSDFPCTVEHRAPKFNGFRPTPAIPALDLVRRSPQLTGEVQGRIEQGRAGTFPRFAP